MDNLQNRLYWNDIEHAVRNTKNMSYFTEKDILIFGASGLIGSFLADCLVYAIEAGMISSHIYVVSRNYSHLKKCFGNEREYLHFLEGNVISLETDLCPDIIINAASDACPRAFREHPVEIMRSNLAGMCHVMDLARKNPDCRVLYVSSGEVQEKVDHLSPRACYPISKRAAETLCLSYTQEYQADAVIVRPCHTFGANFTEMDNRATQQFIQGAAEGRDIVMNSPGYQVRSFAYVADCASGILTALSCGKTGQVYGVASDETCSIRQFADMCARAADVKVMFKEADEVERAEASPISSQIIDNTGLKELGWRPLFSIESGIEHSIQIRRSVG